MPPHLTRSVFRRLLSNEPMVHRGCLYRQARRSLASATQTPRLTIRNGNLFKQYEQRRAFFNLNIFSKKEEAKEADMDPGIEKMMELAKKERMRARLPPAWEVLHALRMFFAARKRKPSEAITDSQAQLALQSLRYCLSSTTNSEHRTDVAETKQIGNQILRNAATVLRKTPATTSEAHVKLARLVYETVLAVSYKTNTQKASFHAYTASLCAAGHSMQARDLLLQSEQTSSNERRPPIELDEDELDERDEGEIIDDQHANENSFVSAWPLVLQGFVVEGNDAEVMRTLAMIEERSAVSTLAVAGIMIRFSLQNNDVNGVTRWWPAYRREQQRHPEASIAAPGLYLGKVLRWCLVRNELPLGHEIVKDIMKTNPPKEMWDAILVWAAGTKKSVDEIDRMMTVMEKSNANISDRSWWRIPDIATINGLVEYAISKNDPYMAERFIALGRDRNIEPDAKTLVLQMDYRLSVDDVDGALVAYKNLQSQDNSSNEDVPTVNRLLVALCKTNRHDFDTIMNVAADLSDRRVRFEPLTVSTLSLLHLSRDERDDVIDLLNTHAFHYSSAERLSIRDAIIAFCLDLKTPTSRAWQGYTVLKTIFDEMPRPERTGLMSSFLDRERSDMGVHVFQNMRMHTRADTIPTIETYVAAFLGFAKLRDFESLEVVHNLLKLDYNINTTTYLYNALIIAYTACGKPHTALGFWENVVASREGPSYNSIHAALRACEKLAWGDLRAKGIWEMLRKRNVELDRDLWASYVAALAGNGDTQMAIRTLEAAVERGEVEVDAFILGSLFAGASGQVKQREVESWGRERFPVEWERLEALGVEEDENGMRAFGIDRRIGP